MSAPHPLSPPGIRIKGSMEWDQRGGIWDRSPGIRDHRPWDRDQQFFEGSGIRLYHFCGIGDQNLSCFGIKSQKFEHKNGISDAKTYFVTSLHDNVFSFFQLGVYKNSYLTRNMFHLSLRIQPLLAARTPPKRPER